MNSLHYSLLYVRIETLYSKVLGPLKLIWAYTKNFKIPFLWFSISSKVLKVVKIWIEWAELSRHTWLYMIIANQKTLLITCLKTDQFCWLALTQWKMKNWSKTKWLNQFYSVLHKYYVLRMIDIHSNSLILKGLKQLWVSSINLHLIL